VAAAATRVLHGACICVVVVVVVVDVVVVVVVVAMASASACQMQLAVLFVVLDVSASSSWLLPRVAIIPITTNMFFLGLVRPVGLAVWSYQKCACSMQHTSRAKPRARCGSRMHDCNTSHVRNHVRDRSDAPAAASRSRRRLVAGAPSRPGAPTAPSGLPHARFVGAHMRR